MRFTWRSFLLLMCSLAFAGVSAFAQYSSGIEGTVTDSTGASIPGAKVILTDTQLGVSKTTTMLF